MPITWKNVSNGDAGFGAAARLMEGAGKNMTGGLDRLGAVVQGELDRKDANRDNTITNNTDAYQDRIASFKTTEELQAAQASGELDTMKQRFNGLVDKDAIRGAETSALDALYARDEAGYKRGRTAIERQAAPAMDLFKQELAAGNLEGAAANLEENAGVYNNLNKLGELQGLLESRGIEVRDTNRTENEYQSNKGMEQLFTDALGQDSELKARRFMTENAGRYGVSASTLFARSDELIPKYRKKFQLTDQQAEEVNDYEARSENTADFIEARATKVRDEIYKNNQLESKYAFTDEQNIGFDDVTAFTQEQGWDMKVPFVSKLAEDIPAMSKELAKEVGMSKEDRRLLPAIAKAAINSLGRPDEWVGQEGLWDSEYRKAFLRTYDEFQNHKVSEANRLDADEAYDNEVKAALAVRNSTSDYRKHKKKSVSRQILGK